MTVYSSPIFYKGAPAQEGPRYVSIVLSNWQYSGDANGGLDPAETLSISLADSGMSSIRSIRIDNYQNPNTVMVVVQDSGQIITVPPFCAVISPIYTGGLFFTATFYYKGLLQGSPVLANSVPVKLFNFDQEHEVLGPGYNVNAFYGTPTLQYAAASPWSSNFQSIPANAWTQIMGSNFTRYRFTVSPDIGFTGNWKCGAGTNTGGPLSYTLAAYSGAGVYEETQVNERFPVTQSAIYIYSSTVYNFFATQWVQ